LFLRSFFEILAIDHMKKITKKTLQSGAL